MLVQDVMNERVVTCRPDTNLAEATARMGEHNCGSLPVIADDETLIAS
jgi:CBS domain-containing protein